MYILNQYVFKTDFVKKYGQWAVITGSTDGIGLAFAKELARRGHSIIVVGRSKEKLAQTKLILESEKSNVQVVTVKIDLSDSSIQNYEKIRSKIDPENRDIGILINNAGTISGYRGFTRYQQEDSRVLINVNILATLYFTRMILPSMLKRKKGLLVNVSSVLAFTQMGFDNGYGSTKAFVNSFGEMLQNELSSHPIDVVTLTPGAVTTKLLTNFTTMTKASVFNPSADDYAKSALNAMATPLHMMSGTMAHGIFLKSCFLAGSYATSAMLRFSTKLTSRDYEPTQSEGDSLATISTAQ